MAAMKGVILSINPEATIVDIEHDISPQGIVEGAFVLSSAVKYFPPAVHIAVVDPGVGTDRRPLVVECDEGVLVGPDNGLLMPPARILGYRTAYEITREDLRLPEVSETFHGRDIFAPVGAHLSKGLSPFEVGDIVKDPVDLDFGEHRVSSEEVMGVILFKDRFGNLVTNVPGGGLPNWVTSGEAVNLQLNEAHQVAYRPTYGLGPAGEALLTISSDGYLEIAVSQGDAAALLRAKPPVPFRLYRSP